jgi:hypothetical protein
VRLLESCLQIKKGEGELLESRRERREHGCHTGCSLAKEEGQDGRAPDVDHGHQWQ